MVEPAGRSMSTFVDAVHAKQVALAKRHVAAAEADRVLMEALASAHAATVDGVGRLDAIAAEIDRAVESRFMMGVDTPMGARKFRTFLIAKQREIFAVVSDTHELDSAKRVALENLLQYYTASVG
jgi:hypothetical protein